MKDQDLSVLSSSIDIMPDVVGSRFFRKLIAMSEGGNGIRIFEFFSDPDNYSLLEMSSQESSDFRIRTVAAGAGTKRKIVINDTLEVDENGFITFSGAAMPYDDWTFPFTQVKQGANLKPDFDETNVGLLFPQNDPSEKIFMIGQTPHARAVDSDLMPHIHWTQKAATAVTFKLDYKWYNAGEAEPAGWTTLTSVDNVFSYVSGSLAQITTFPTITGTGMRPSSIMKCKFYRDDNTTTGDVLADQFDFHIRRDGMGSANPYTK